MRCQKTAKAGGYRYPQARRTAQTPGSAEHGGLRRPTGVSARDRATLRSQDTTSGRADARGALAASSPASSTAALRSRKGKKATWYSREGPFGHDAQQLRVVCRRSEESSTPWIELCPSLRGWPRTLSQEGVAKDFLCFKYFHNSSCLRPYGCPLPMQTARLSKVKWFNQLADQ
jgi:hypothetical protein